jgi:opacity protein-like surface antigen
MRKIVVIAMLLLLGGTFAAAQKAELAGGWNYLHVSTDISPTQNGFPGGFFVDGTYYFLKVVGLTGDFEYNKKTYSADSFFNGGETANALSFHGGPRVKARMGKIEPFAHALFGFTRVSESVPGFPSDSDTAFSLKLGGGLDVGFTPHIAIRVAEFNYYMTRFPVTSFVNFAGVNASQGNYTFSVGVVLR